MDCPEYIFIGPKEEPFFMIELNKSQHTIMILKPDKYSKKLKDVFEKYYLGEILHKINYDKLITIKDDGKEFTKIKDFTATILSELLIKIKNNEYFLIKEDIYSSHDYARK